MDSLAAVELHAMKIRHAAWMVRHYARGYRVSGRPRELREDAIRQLGAIVRDAFNESENYEQLLVAVVDGLRPRIEEQPF